MSSRVILTRMPGSTQRRHCNCDQASPSASLLNVISRPSTLPFKTMMAMNDMKANEEDFETAGEAKEAIEERHKTTKNKQMIIADTVDTVTTATLLSEVPCCSQCRKQFPLNEWIAVCRCPIAEGHAGRECNAELLHRHCVQAHYAVCHPEDECPET